MKKGFFSKKLFVNMLNQQRIAGLILLAVMLVICFICMVSFIENYNSPRPYTYMVTAKMADFAPIFIVYMFVAGIALPFKAFSFLNKRSGSDFYHSLPISRRSMYISIIMSSLVWIVASLVLATLFVILGFAVCSVPLLTTDFVQMIATIMSGALLIAACASLACSLTGTRFSNIILTLLILFLPRFILFLAYYGIYQIAPIIPISNYSFILEPSCNFPVATVFNVFSIFLYTSGSASTQSLLFEGSTLIYTFVLALVYFGLGCMAFVKRRSETADKAAPNRLLQHVYRIAISLPPLILLVFILYQPGEVGIGGLVLVALSLICYFLFELITTKSGKSMLKAAPLYLVSVAIAAAFFFSVKGIGFAELNRVPNAQDIKSVSIQDTSSDNFIGRICYADLMTLSAEYDDENLKNIFANALTVTVDEINRNKAGESTDYRSFNTQRIRFTLSSGNTMIRDVYMSETEYDRFKTIVMNDPVYRENATKLPPDDTIDVVRSEANLSSKEYMEIYNTFKEEYAALSLDDKMKVVTSQYFLPDSKEDNSAPENYSFIITVTGEYEHEQYSSMFIVLKSMTKTIEKYTQICTKYDTESWNKFLNLEPIDKDVWQSDYFYAYIAFSTFAQDGSEIYSNVVYDSTVYKEIDASDPGKQIESISMEELNNFIALLQRGKVEDPLSSTFDTHKLLCIHDVSLSSYGESIVFYNMYLSFSDEDYAKIQELVLASGYGEI